MEILRSVGIISALKAFFVFFVYGVSIILFIKIFYGLDADLPDAVIATLEGPISLYTFLWLSIFGLIALFFATKYGSRHCDFYNSRPKRVFWFSLPICEAAIALGVVICGTFLGVAFCSHALFKLSLTDVLFYSQFYGLAAVMLIITFPVVYFTISLVDSGKAIYFWNSGGLFFYFLFVIYSYFYINLPVDHVSIVGMQASVLMLGCAAWRYHQPDN
ncbi:hypothetical protein [Halomonas llamarensis]|uniref:Uncharacterized protein n=1 Tax=Halomonas llamarensis TaxID=2945104 RepID=A0ABT0SUN5_9GAMM|nr:hypothetical protein [Halomonas llamarensis]MCL7931538.1 hypothetical protein [Halomonas llamarensis]